MKHIVRKKVCTVLLVMGICFSAYPPSPVCSETETLRMLIWDLCAPEDQRQKFIGQVKEKHGIDLKIEVTNVASNDDFFPALRDGKTDLIATAHTVPKDKRFQLIDLNLVLPLNLDNIPNYKNVIPFFQKADYGSEGGKVYGIPFVTGPYALVYNTALVQPPPDSWNILWDPKYKGKYALGDQYAENVFITALASGMPVKDIFIYKNVNTPDIQKKLGELAANAHLIWKAGDRAEDLKGLALATSWGTTSLNDLAKMGETWKIAEPKEGTTGWLDYYMISHTLKDKPKLKQIAEEWLNHVLSDEFQTYVVRGMFCTPTTATVKEVLTTEETEKLHLDDPGHFEASVILWNILEKQDRKGFQRLWNMAVEAGK